MGVCKKGERKCNITLLLESNVHVSVLRTKGGTVETLSLAGTDKFFFGVKGNIM